MSRHGAPCQIAVENAFSPIVAASCASGFDFTLLFEEAILTILPLGIAIAWAIPRFLVLRNEAVKVWSSWLLASKMLLFAVYVTFQAILLILWVVRRVPRTGLTVPCIALTVAGYAILSLLSYLEHRRSVRPSTLLSVYLGISTLLDLARVRTLFLIADNQAVARVLLASFCIKILTFVLEVKEKYSLLRPKWKNASPEARGGVYNRSFFIWLNELFLRGFRTHLTVDTLTPIDDAILAASKPSALIERWGKANKSSEHALLWIFLQHYKWSLLAGVLPRLAFAGFTFAQPYLVQRVLDFTTEPKGPNTRNTAYGLIGAYAIVYIGTALSYTVYQHKIYRVLTLFRGSLITLIYSKTIRVSTVVTTGAEAITLMSADIDRIGFSIPLLHETYASVVDTLLCLWLLYRFLGVAMVAPIMWIVVCLLIGIPISNAAGNAQVPWLDAIEERLAVTSKALGVMKAMRMTGLTSITSSKIANLRLSEIRASRRYRLFNVFVAITSFASSALAPVWGFGLYILLAKANHTKTLTEGVAFAALSLFETLNQPLMFAVSAVEDYRIVVNSFRRIQEYILSEEQKDYRITPMTQTPRESYQQENDKLPRKGFLKSHLNLGLENSESAALVKDASAGYASGKQPTLKNLSFEIPRGQKTMLFGPVGCGKSTLLKLLLGEMPSTSGSVSTNFSTAAFCPQSPWTISGSIRRNIVGMSTWDKPWYDTIVRACMLSADFEELPRGDQTDVGTRGSRLSGGQQTRVSLARALYSRLPMVILDDVLAGLDRATEQSILDAVFGQNGLFKQLGSTVVLATNSANHLHFADNIIVLNEDGQVALQGTPESISGSELIQKLAAQSPITTSQPEPEISAEILQQLETVECQEPGSSRKTGDMKIYAYYAKIAGWWTILAYLLTCATFVFGVSFPSIWLQWWTDANTKHPNERVGYWLGVYGALAIVTILGCCISDCVFNLIVVPKTSKKFHELLLNTTMQAHTSFLTSTDAGTTTNRFSQDLELIDNDLPKSLDSTVFQLMSAIVSSVLVFTGSGYVAAAMPICIVCLALIQFYYLRTSRQLRLLDIEAKAPLFSHFLETINGISCIRAYGWTDSYLQRSYEVLDASQKPYYLMWCIQRWLTLVLDLFVSGVAILLVALATNIRSGSTGFLGVALFNVVTFSSTLQILVTEWTQVETAIGAINRIRSYTLQVKNENLASEVDEVPPDWPASGEIVLKDVSASYELSLEPALKHINLSIKAGERVAICGRTGSGKSSLISALLRILDIDSGAILIDNVDISTIPRQEVRARLNTLPQDPFFLHGSVRDNLDPLQTTSDDRIIEVLRIVGLWETFEPHGLGSDFDEETLSHGQRQLFCLARAVIKPGSILIMDEATSNMDADTEDLMQRVLRDELGGRTVLTIAHRLHTVLDYNCVVLLDKGRVIETGNPLELLETPKSAFRALHDALR